MLRSLLAFLSISLLTATAQVPAGGSIAGQVVDGNTATPLAQATVEITPIGGRPQRMDQPPSRPQPLTIQTDEQGRFSLQHLASGIYMVRAQKAGFLFGGNSFGPSQLVLGEEQALAGVVLNLTAEPALAGKVTGISGEAVAHATVTVLRQVYVQSHAQWVAVYSFQTGEQGEYRIGGVAPGHYRILASFHDATRQASDKPETRYVPTWYPASTSAAAAQLVAVTAAGAASADIKMQSALTVRLRGKVVDPTGNPFAVAPTLTPADGSPVSFHISAANGDFEIDDLPAGAYSLSARMVPNAPSPAAFQSIVVADKPLDGIVLRLASPRDVSGTVQLENGGGVDPRNLTIIANSLDAPGSMVAVKGDGASQFVLHNLPHGRTSLTIYTPSNFYVKSILYGGKELSGAGADLAGGESLTVTLSTGGAMVSGHITDAAGKPLRSAIALLGPNGELEQTVADRPGDYRLRMVHPGEYKLYAFDLADGLNLQDADVFRQYGSAARTIKLTAGENATVNSSVIAVAAGPMRLPHAKGSVEGTVVNAKTGEPVSGAALRAVNSGFGAVIFAASPYTNNSPGTPAARTDEQGHFLLTGLDSGAYQLSADRPGYLNAIYGMRRDNTADPLILGEGQSLKGVSIRLTPQFVITGKVVDESGEAVAGATAMLYSRDAIGRRSGVAPLKAVATNAQGVYRFESLPAGTYYVSAHPEPPMPPAELALLPVPDFPEMRHVTTFYPASTDFAGAKAIVLAGGNSTAQADIAVHKIAIFEIRGNLTDMPAPGTPGGVPLGSMPGPPTVRLYPPQSANPDMPGVGTVVALTNGTFTILDVPPGSYVLLAKPYVYDPAHQVAASMPIEITNKHIAGLALPLKAGVDVKGKVTWDPPPAKPVAGLFVVLSGIYPVGAQSAAQPFDVDGTLLFRNVLQHPARVEFLEMPPNCQCFVKAVRYAGRDIGEGVVDFTTGGEVEIVMSATAGIIDGTVVNSEGQPVGAAIVELIGGDGKLRAAAADEAGRFVVNAVAPGEYQLFALEHPDADPSTFPTAGGQRIKVEPLGRQTVRIVATPAK